MLIKLDFSLKEIRKIQSRWHYWVEGDYIRGLINNSNINHPEIPIENHEAWYVKRKELQENIDTLQPDDLRRAFNELGGYSEKVDSIINDQVYYKNHKVHRDREKWKMQGYWFGL